MTIIEWKPDSCQCIIHIQMPQHTMFKVIQKCQIHKDESDNSILETITTHNRQFSAKEMIDARREEYARILEMGDPEIQ